MAEIVASMKYQKYPMIILVVIDYLKNIEDNCQIFRVWLVTLLFFKYRSRKQTFFKESGGTTKQLRYTDEISILYPNSLEPSAAVAVGGGVSAQGGVCRGDV